jgi:uncharacterized membrane protein YecN with MAPEG domain
MPPVITALYGALNAILNIILAERVSRLRGRHKVPLGTGEAPQLLVAIRGHANNAEFVPFALLMLLLAELCGGNRAFLHVLGGLLLLARIAHPIGLAQKKSPNPYRYLGTAVTWIMIVVSAAYVLYLRFRVVGTI